MNWEDRRAATEFRRELKQAIVLGGAIAGIILIGALGYRLIEGWDLFEALYMTVITIFTVGFLEVEPLSTAGRVFTIFLILGGASLILYSLTVLLEFIVGGRLTGLYRRRTLTRELKNLKSHYIICGYGRVGEAVAKELAAHRAPFVVVDDNLDSVHRAEESSFTALLGDAAEDDVLEAAGIRNAKGLVAAMGSDATNVFVTLSARVLNPSLMIVARADTSETVGKLQKAGANHVISPEGIGGRKMATMMLKPLVSDYVEVVTGAGELEFRVEQLELSGACPVVGQTIAGLEVRKRTGATILAVRHSQTGVFDTNPPPNVRLDNGDVLIAVGTPAEMAKLEELFACGMPRTPGSPG